MKFFRKDETKDTDLWEVDEIRQSRFNRDTILADDFIVVDKTAASMTLHGGESPRKDPREPRHMDTIVVLRADVDTKNQVVRFRLQCVVAMDRSPAETAISRSAITTVSLLFSEITSDAPRKSSTGPSDDTAPTESALDDTADRSAPSARVLEKRPSTSGSSVTHDVGSAIVPSDLWSAAYHEAVDSLGEDIDVAILKGNNVAQLFRELEEIDKNATKESAFLRGVEYLRSLQVPLERFKLALDLASPLTAAEPTTSAVFGVVRGVTAIAISFATADLDFAKQIGDMLEQISYIDDCDTLGQRSNKQDIHDALVLVYQNILQFYKAAFDILTRHGAKLVMKMVLETDRLPTIVQSFLGHANHLRNLVQKATWEIVEDIKCMLYDREIARWLGSGNMRQQSQYHASLQDIRADEACEFLLTDPTFTKWYRASNSQQLVILGDMGCGKTISMAFLIDALTRRNEYQIPQPKLCYYYCRNDETGQATHILSGLILGLLEQLSGLKKSFFDWYKKTQASGCFEPATNVKKLEEFLKHVLETLDRPLFFIIDGLDECDRASRNALLAVLATLLRTAPMLKVLLSSRPQEEILEQLGDTARIDLSSNPERDATIVKKTVHKQLSYLSDDVKALVIERLSSLANGSAIWTKMIVELIELRRIRALGPMRRFLDEKTLPLDLSNLYAALLSRCTSTDPENKDLATTALNVLAISRRPLSLLELAWAAALGVAPKEVTTVAALAELVDHQRVMSLIYPFVSRVDFSDVNKRQVRLVHQSVKEFVIRESTRNQPRRQYPVASRPTHQLTLSQGIESLEACLMDICIRYLLLEEIGSKDLFSEEQVLIQALPQTSDIFDDDLELADYDPHCSWEVWEEEMVRYDPTERGFGELFVYASCHWVDHFGAITEDPLPDLGSIERLCHAGSTQLYNWASQNSRPTCTFRQRFPFDGPLHDPLSVTAMFGSEAMLRHMLENSDFNKDAFLPQPAIGAADQVLQWAGLSQLDILFSSQKVGHQLRSLQFFGLVVRQWYTPLAQHENWELAFDLVEGVLDTMAQEGWGHELLRMAAGFRCMPVIQRLAIGARNNEGLRSELLSGVRPDQKDRLWATLQCRELEISAIVAALGPEI
ncbi:related to vegetatible incompatibility protein HET-E-1 [Cephalotrichum gorgonifer]|uniref:Related to vegetatible incompatibility protein HET-E-1 n=1 Tax=Cephalotrichum gorgonifer TaxID=2041049 RepID=A0AAE8MXE6_9PEZI|nr:related to vegetatible incompatibility protein HET-E-1 [Cephalotrichum gorgonifer]